MKDVEEEENLCTSSWRKMGLGSFEEGIFESSTPQLFDSKTKQNLSGDVIYPFSRAAVYGGVSNGKTALQRIIIHMLFSVGSFEKITSLRVLYSTL